MISVSGIRGVVPEGLDPTNIVSFARAYASVTGKRIVIGNDSRATGPILEHLLIGTLLAAGKEVIQTGLVPTPTVKAAVKFWKADAGVMISASHNPPEWNAFKLIRKGGFFFEQTHLDQMLAALKEDRFPAVAYKNMGSLVRKDAVAEHIRSILRIIPNKERIRKRRYTVVVDATGGAGREALPALLEELGCKVRKLHCGELVRGEFPRPPEPTPSALRKFSRFLKREKISVGFALDPDSDRLVVGTPEKGAVPEEYTLPLALLGVSKIPRKGTIVVNLSTANLIDHVARGLGARVLRSAVGEANVVAKMLKTRAFFGGEGNGGVIDPRVPSFGRDALAGAALILSAMERAGAPTADGLLSDLPALHMDKAKRELRGDFQAICDSLQKGFPQTKIDTTDGLHLTFPDASWLHARPSNTEPVLRLIAQAPSKRELRELMKAADAFF